MALLYPPHTRTSMQLHKLKSSGLFEGNVPHSDEAVKTLEEDKSIHFVERTDLTQSVLFLIQMHKVVVQEFQCCSFSPSATTLTFQALEERIKDSLSILKSDCKACHVPRGDLQWRGKLNKIVATVPKFGEEKKRVILQRFPTEDALRKAFLLNPGATRQ